MDRCVGENDAWGQKGTQKREKEGRGVLGL